MRLTRSPIIFPIQKASIAKMRCDAVKFQFVEYIKKLLAAIMVVRSSFYALICTGYAQGMHRGRFLVLTKQGGWLTPPLTPVHKNTVRNGKSERISNLKERVRIILVWCGRQELNLHGCPPVPKTGVSAIPPRPRIHLIVIKTGKRRHSFRYSL